MRYPCDKIQGEHISEGECPYCRIKQLEDERRMYIEEKALFKQQIEQLEAKIQELLDHAKYLHDCLDDFPCKLCEEIELKVLKDKE